MTPQEFKHIQVDLDATNNQLARVLGVTPTTICNIRNGRHAITGPIALAMRMLKHHGDFQKWAN